MPVHIFLLIHISAKVPGRSVESEDPSSAGSLPSDCNHFKLGQPEGRSQKLHLNLMCKLEESKLLDHLLLLKNSSKKSELDLNQPSIWITKISGSGLIYHTTVLAHKHHIFNDSNHMPIHEGWTLNILKYFYTVLLLIIFISTIRMQWNSLFKQQQKKMLKKICLPQFPGYFL